MTIKQKLTNLYYRITRGYNVYLTESECRAIELTINESIAVTKREQGSNYS